MSNGRIDGRLYDAKGVTGTVTARGNMSGNIMYTVLKGLSAYEVAVENGFEGTVEDWLESLVGNGIQTVVLNGDNTLTLVFTNGESYTTPIPIRGKDGHSPYIGDNGHWYIYDDVQDEYIDSGYTSIILIGDGLVIDPVTGEISVDSTDQVVLGSNKLITSGGVYAKLNNLDYEELNNKPLIEDVELLGNKTFIQLGIAPIDSNDLLEILT